MNRHNLYTVTSFTLFAATVYALQAPMMLTDAGSSAVVRTHAAPPLRDAWVGVPEGTRVRVRLESPLSTRDASVGDAFVARVAHTVVVDGQSSIPAGATVIGHVIDCDHPRTRGTHRLQLRFDALDVDGDRYAIGSRGMPYEARSGKRERGVLASTSAATVATPALVPADPAWTAPGPDVTFARGTLLEFRLDRSLRVRL